MNATLKPKSNAGNTAPEQTPRQPYWRRVAGVLWAGFLGAVLMMPVFIWVTDQFDSGLDLMTRLFITSWAICSVPAAMAWLLASDQTGQQADQ